MRYSVLPVALLLMLAACADQKAPSTQSGQPPSPKAVHKSGSSTGAPASGIDTTDGVLTITGSGAVARTWRLRDANAYVEQHAVAGSTRSVLTVEGHDEVLHIHVRFRMIRDDDDIDAGTYAIERAGSSTSRRLEARFEAAGVQYLSALRGSGRVTLNSLTDTRASGTFEVTLGSIGRDSLTEKLSGSFNNALNRE